MSEKQLPRLTRIIFSILYHSFERESKVFILINHKIKKLIVSDI